MAPFSDVVNPTKSLPDAASNIARVAFFSLVAFVLGRS